MQVVWFRQDLRLSDHAPLCQAMASGEPVLLLYILDEANNRPLGGAARWRLHHSLSALMESCQARGASLVLRRGDALNIFEELCVKFSLSKIYWHQCYEPTARLLDKKLIKLLQQHRVQAQPMPGRLLLEPAELQTKQGGYYKVFTPYYHAARANIDMCQPLLAPQSMSEMPQIKSDSLADWQLKPEQPNWASHFPLEVGETAAHAQLENFMVTALGSYESGRDDFASTKTSRLAAALSWGEISVRQVWYALLQHKSLTSEPEAPIEAFLRQLVWRDFAHYLLWHFPRLPWQNYLTSFDDFPWQTSRENLQAWQQGRTGYPIVDAAMRCLWQRGEMHNRLRMIVASFLTKHLLLDWREGEAWFWDTLLDADMANNAFGWQWVAGSGVDAAPYFRIFNPITQSQKFDPSARFVRQWLPELAALPDRYIHFPATAPQQVLAQCQVVLGENYPKPVVEHAVARERALLAYQAIKRSK